MPQDSQNVPVDAHRAGSGIENQIHREPLAGDGTPTEALCISVRSPPIALAVEIKGAQRFGWLTTAHLLCRRLEADETQGLRIRQTPRDKLPSWFRMRLALCRQPDVLLNVAASGYDLCMTSVGIRALKDNLSRYIRRIEAGERIAITAHGRVVAKLVPPRAQTRGTPSRFDELVASGVIRPPLEDGDPTEGWPDIRLPAGTAAELIDGDRGEA
jgi:prevent-host-death family protein